VVGVVGGLMERVAQTKDVRLVLTRLRAVRGDAVPFNGAGCLGFGEVNWSLDRLCDS